MPRFMLDTNCMVALLLSRHEHHVRAVGEVERRLNAGETLVLAAHTLVEAYAVLTRLPPPNRIAPDDCRTLLEASFPPEILDMVTLSADHYRRLIHNAPDGKLAGGRIYDAVIAACARLGRVDTFLTFNRKHFEQFADKDFLIVVPS